MNITRGKLILLASVPLVLALAWGIITTIHLKSTEATLRQNTVTLSQTQTELSDTKQQLADVRAELSTTQNDLTQANTTLTQTQTQLSNSQIELSSTQTQLSTAQNQLTAVNSQLSSTQSQLSSAQSQLSSTQAQLASSQQLLADYKKTMQAMGIAVHSATSTWDFNGLQWTHSDNAQSANPTWNQLLTFVAQDKTDQHIYNLRTFNCVNYATTVYNDAEALGIEAATVTINLKNSTVGHAVNAFITSDYGLVFVDCTQSDKISRVEAGKLYRAVSPGSMQLAQLNNDSWWDNLTGQYFFVTNDYGGQAVVDSIDIYW